MTVLQQIKRAVFSGKIEFTEKAAMDLEHDDLVEQDVIESIVYAKGISKTMRSTSVGRQHRRERLHVIIGVNLAGTLIYSKGKFVEERGTGRYYVLVSAKRAD